MAIESIIEVKKKKEFSRLPDSLVEKALSLNKEDVKLTRAFLRKYFGVFLTNKVLKPRDISNWEQVLSSHLSSKKRDYSVFYPKIFQVLPEKSFNSIIDLGSGINGFSLPKITLFCNFKKYRGVESVGQIVDLTNKFFSSEMKGIDARVSWLDLFDLDAIRKLIISCKSPRVVFLFQVVDALENLERNFSKKLVENIFELFSGEDSLVVSLPVESLSGKTRFKVQRNWFVDFLNERFCIINDFVLNGERIIIVRKN
jgi:hypothetical protein